MNQYLREFKVTSAWISIIYVVCYLGVALYPPIRPITLKYALHLDVALQSGPFDLGIFIAGLVIWNVVAFLAVWLFLALNKAIKR